MNYSHFLLGQIIYKPYTEYILTHVHSMVENGTKCIQRFQWYISSFWHRSVMRYVMGLHTLRRIQLLINNWTMTNFQKRFNGIHLLIQNLNAPNLTLLTGFQSFLIILLLLFSVLTKISKWQIYSDLHINKESVSVFIAASSTKHQNNTSLDDHGGDGLLIAHK